MSDVQKQDYEVQAGEDDQGAEQVTDSHIDENASQLNLKVMEPARSRKILWVIFISVFILGLLITSFYLYPFNIKDNKKSGQVGEKKENVDKVTLIEPFENSNNDNNKGVVEFKKNIQKQSSNEAIIQPKRQPEQSNPEPKTKDPQQQNKIPIEQVENRANHIPTIEHPHKKLTFSYPTMGMKQPGKQFNFTIVNREQVYQFQKQMEKVFKPYTDTDCQLERFGDQDDGGYLMCKNLMKNTTGLINFGIQGRDLFGCQISSIFNMTNYQFDCTNSVAPICDTNQNKNVFEMGCIGEKSQQSYQKFYSLKDIVDLKNLTKKHVMMKIDVEGAEWPGLRTFPMEYLDYVDHFVFEIHFQGGGLTHENYWGNLDIVKALGEKFVSVNFHVNNNGCWQTYLVDFSYFKSLAIEVTLVNKKLINIKSDTRSYKLDPKNYINNQNIVDCQMND